MFTLGISGELFASKRRLMYHAQNYGEPLHLVERVALRLNIIEYPTFIDINLLHWRPILRRQCDIQVITNLFKSHS